MKTYLTLLLAFLCVITNAQTRKVQPGNVLFYKDKELTILYQGALYVDSITITHYKGNIWFTYYKSDTLYVDESYFKEIVADKEPGR